MKLVKATSNLSLDKDLDPDTKAIVEGIKRHNPHVKFEYGEYPKEFNPTILYYAGEFCRDPIPFN